MDIAGIWDGWYSRVMNVVQVAAVSAVVIAAGLWLAWAVLRHVDGRFRRITGESQRREAVLIKTIGWLSERPTQPMPRVP
jgi:hypothetical protein